MDDEGVKELIVIKGTQKSLGIEIVGGTRRNSTSDNPDFGVFVKKVIANKPAHKDGRLKRGDQILEANGKSLLGVSNARAVEILRRCAQTNEVAIVISRDQQSQQDFRRLSESLLLEPLSYAVPPPEATSTPVFQNNNSGDSDGTISGGEEPTREGGGVAFRRPPSTSSDLTNVSNISSHEYGLDEEEVFAAATSAMLQEGPLTLSDVRVDLKQQPPPIPSSPPPSLDASGNSNSLQRSRLDRYKVPDDDMPVIGRVSPDGRDMTPLGQSGAIQFPDTRTFVFPKKLGLGVLVGGGRDREGGPHITIDKILDGMDAAKDGNLKRGDRLISVNGEDFVNISREKALTLLTSIKQNQSVSMYNVVIERVAEARDGSKFSVTTPTSLPSPLRGDNAKIFNSDTILASEVKSTSTGKDKVSLRKKKDAEDKRRFDSMQNRMSMDPNTRCKLDKLEWALKYIGHTMTPDQQKHMRSSLDVDRQGKVVFSNFVKMAQEMFAFRLDDQKVQTKFMLALTDKMDMAMPPMPKKAISNEDVWDSSFKETYIKPAKSQPLLPLATSSGSVKSDTDMEQMRQALQQLGKLKDKQLEQISEELHKEKLRTSQLQEDLEKLETEPAKPKRQVSKEILIKTTAMAEDAFKLERDKANHLEDSIRKMTAELDVLRGYQPDMNLEETRKRLAVIDNELRKEKQLTRRYQVATERLMQFVEDCHEALVKSPEVDRIMYHPHGKGLSVQRGNAVTGNPRPPQYLSKHAKMTSVTLAKEARDTLHSVRKMLEAESLPFGWEEAYTKDGRKYYMNHETQTTSWVHPLARLSSHHSRSSSRSATPSISSQQPPSEILH